MDISLTGMTVTPNSTIGSGTGLLSGGIDFGWQPGQVFEGIVLDRVAVNTYVIRVDGKDVVAESSCVLAKDQAITMEVQGKNNSKYMVRLLDIALTGEGDMFKSIIKQLGMEDNPLNRALVQGFLAQELPLKPKLLKQAAFTLQVSGRCSPDDVNPILLALKWGIPPKPRVLEAIQAFLSGLRETEMGSERQLARLAQELTGFLDGITEGSQPPGYEIDHPFQQEGVPSITLSKEGAVLFQQVKDILRAIILKPQEGAEKVTEQLRSLLGFQLPKSFQNGSETRSFDIVSNGNKSGQSVDGMPDRAGNGQSPGTGVFRNEIAAEIHGKSFRAFGELLEKFGQLLQEVRVAVKEAGFFQKGQSIVYEGAEIERQMAGHQIFQSLQRDSCQQDYLYFNLPFINNGETETWGQLRILKNADGKKIIDPKRFSTVILLNTENLGPLLLEIKVWNKEVTANGKVTEDWVAQMLKKAWPKLQAPFEAMGYRLRQCQWNVGPFEENLRPGEVDPPKVRRGFRFLDTKV